MAKCDQPRGNVPIKKRAENGQSRRSGTRVAIIPKLLSAGAIPAGSGWGGARNTGSRVTDGLSVDKCEAMLAAAAKAGALGLPFNRHWTVHYERAGIAEHDAVRFVGRLRKYASDYARRHNGKFAVMWVRESGDGKGGHVHMLMHLPADLRLNGRTRRWINLAGGRCMAKVSRVTAIAGRIGAAERGGAHYASNLATVRSYLLKGADRATCEALGLDYRGSQGTVVGKRCGWSQNIG